MSNRPRHEMELETIHATGAEEWFCPTCGRRFIMQWPPAYKKIVLDQGDIQVMHSGGTGGLRIDSAQPAPLPDDHPAHDNLDLWRDGLQDINLE